MNAKGDMTHAKDTVKDPVTGARPPKGGASEDTHERSNQSNGIGSSHPQARREQ